MIRRLKKIEATLRRMILSHEVNRWFDDNGDKTHRLNYDLDENSVVLDLGGYQGQWTSDIFSKYCCRIYIFEPVKAYHESIVNRFRENRKISCYNYGLANRNYKCLISLDEDGSSIFRTGGLTQEISLLKAEDFFNNNGINQIDLMKINIEGAEYDLIEHLIESGRINTIKNLQVQFHKINSSSQKRMESIQKELNKTHELTYQYLFVWENWRFKC